MLLIVCPFVMVSYGTCYLINRVNSRIFTIVILIFTSTTSFYVFYASSIGRDATYSACLFLMGVFYLRISEEWGSGNYKKALLYSVLYSAVALLACLLRNNGIYVTVISTLVCPVYAFPFAYLEEVADIFVCALHIVYVGIGFVDSSRECGIVLLVV